MSDFCTRINLERQLQACWSVLKRLELYYLWNDSRYFRRMKVLSSPSPEFMKVAESVNLFQGFDLTWRVPMEVYIDDSNKKMVFRWLYSRYLLDIYEIQHQFSLVESDGGLGCVFLHTFEVKGILGRFLRRLTPGVYREVLAQHERFNRCLKDFVEGELDKVSGFEAIS